MDRVASSVSAKTSSAEAAADGAAEGKSSRERPELRSTAPTRPLASRPVLARRPSGSYRVLACALAVGLVAGLLVVLIKALVVWLQAASLGFVAEHAIPDLSATDAVRVTLALAAAGMIIAGVTAAAEALDRRRGRPAPIDAVEANALRGGILTGRDGVSVVGPILTSVGSGASVGIEAAVTQVGAVLASMLGQRRRLARSEIRLLVGAGAAASIGAAYDAPVAGALYAFELVLGEYRPSMLAPVGLAAAAGAVLARHLGGGAAAFAPLHLVPMTGLDILFAALIGAICALLGIATMVMASSTERGLRRLLPWTVPRFLAGAIALGLLALACPGVLGSGHASIGETVDGRIVGLSALGLLAAKIVASAISLGAGYRGGLFSASLLIGALVGQSFAAAMPLLGLPPIPPALCAAIGMAALGTSIIGCPLAMIFLVLETSGSIELAVVVATGAAIASFLTGRLFGYSFATWRFQQRGLALDGGQDVSRLAAVPIKTLARPPKCTLDARTGLEVVLRAVSSAGGRGTAVFAADGTFIGLIDPALVELAVAGPGLPIVAADLVYGTAATITDAATVADAIDLFRADDRATIAVVEAANSSRLVGCVRARDAFAAAISQADAQRWSDIGVR